MRAAQQNRKEAVMTKSRKLAGLISAMLAMIFSGCVIGWLYCVKPQLFGSAISGRDIAFDYVILYLLWWCLAPATTACMAGGPFFLWCAVLLPTELLFALVIFRKVWPVGVLLAALWLIGLLRFRRKCLRQFRRKSRRCHYSDFDILCGQDRIREICRRFGVLLAVLLLAVPSAWGVWSSRNCPTELRQTQTAATAQAHSTEFLFGFAEDAWSAASLDEKAARAEQLVSYEFAMLGVPADGMEVSFKELDEDRLGYYSAASQQIVLDRTELQDGSVWEVIDTIAHETFHAQQAYVVTNIDWDDAATQAAYYDQARRWLRNYQTGYISGEEDLLGYYYQPLEADARAYAKEETERLQELISRNL